MAFLSGMVNKKMVLKGLKADLELLVIDPPPGLEVCLDDTRLDQHEAVIDYENRCLLLKKEEEVPTCM